MNNTFEKYLYTVWYSEFLDWFKEDIKFYLSLKKPEVREMYKSHIEWQVLEMKKLKDKIKNL